ncbi:MAG: response regulator, partial [Chloroflexota bacterium]|nr:response regulator [Chloroflexota bacterium]
MTAQTPPPEKPSEGPTILVVEDDPVMADIVRGALEHAGYRVETATTGEEGIALAQQVGPRLI